MGDGGYEVDDLLGLLVVAAHEVLPFRDGLASSRRWFGIDADSIVAVPLEVFLQVADYYLDSFLVVAIDGQECAAGGLRRRRRSRCR